MQEHHQNSISILIHRQIASAWSFQYSWQWFRDEEKKKKNNIHSNKYQTISFPLKEPQKESAEKEEEEGKKLRTSVQHIEIYQCGST